MGRPRMQEQQNKKSSDFEKKNVIFKRRKQGIMKKAMELSTLCDIPVLVIIRSPNGNLEVWPENPCQVRNILEKYGKTNPRQNTEETKVRETTILEKYGKRNPRQNPEEIEVREATLMMNDGLSTHQELVLSGENISSTGGVQNDFGPNNDQQHCLGAEIVENNNTNPISDDDLFFGWKQTLGFNLDDLQPQPLQVSYPDMNFSLDPYLGNIWNGQNLGFGVEDPDFGCTWNGEILDSGFNPDLG